MVNATEPTHVVPEHPSTYLAILNEQLEIRVREHGQAWVTPQEDAWIRANDLKLRNPYTIRGSNWTGKARDRAGQE
jgi:hypothetical protein